MEVGAVLHVQKKDIISFQLVTKSHLHYMISLLPLLKTFVFCPQRFADLGMTSICHGFDAA